MSIVERGRKIATTVLFSLMAVSAGAAVGGGVAGLLQPDQLVAAEEEYCEHDYCAEICVGDVCGGTCYDGVMTFKNCNKTGPTCKTQPCWLS